MLAVMDLAALIVAILSMLSGIVQATLALREAPKKRLSEAKYFDLGEREYFTLNLPIMAFWFSSCRARA